MLTPMRRRRSALLLRAVLLSGLAACGDDPAGPRRAPLCEGPVTVSAGPGVRPELTWSPACRVHVLSLENLSDGTSTWFLLADPFTQRALVPPIRYGVVPPDALDLTSGLTMDLQTGTRYEVTLIINQSPGGDVVIGRAEFVP
jgi:hypothetical protein